MMGYKKKLAEATSHLQIIRTWASVGIRYGDAISGECLKDIVAWSDEALEVLRDMPEENCVNCRRYEECQTVRKRKETKANNYTACAKWEGKL